MLLAAKAIREHVAGLDLPSFRKSPRDQDAVLRQFTILGEAASRVSPEFQASHPDIPWAKITAFRNIIVHEYPTVNLLRVWEIAQDDLPDLVHVLEPLVPPETP